MELKLLLSDCSRPAGGEVRLQTKQQPGQSGQSSPVQLSHSPSNENNTFTLPLKIVPPPPVSPTRGPQPAVRQSACYQDQQAGEEVWGTWPGVVRERERERVETIDHRCPGAATPPRGFVNINLPSSPSPSIQTISRHLQLYLICLN